MCNKGDFWWVQILIWEFTLVVFVITFNWNISCISVACYPGTSLWFNVPLNSPIQTFPQQHREGKQFFRCLELSHLVTVSSLNTAWAATQSEIRKPQELSRALRRSRSAFVKISGKNPLHWCPVIVDDAASSVACRNLHHIISCIDIN